MNRITPLLFTASGAAIASGFFMIYGQGVPSGGGIIFCGVVSLFAACFLEGW